MGRKNRSISPRDTSRRRVWIYAAVGVFLIIDAILVTTALTSTRVDTSRPAAAPSATVAPALTATPTSTATPKPTVAARTVPATRVLAAASATVAWRAVTGTCPNPLAEPEISTDSGATWTTTDANGPTGITALQSINASNASVAQFLGFAASDCSPLVIRTFVGGDNYSAADELEGSWYVDPVNRAEVHGPSGVQAAPCDQIVALSPGAGANTAAVLCSDSRVFATSDAALSWSEPVAVSGALTLTATPDGYVIVADGSATGQPPASANSDSDPGACVGLSVIRVTPADDAAAATALTPTTTGCYVTAETRAALAGAIATAVADDTLWLWIGDATWRSTDGGRTWV